MFSHKVAREGVSDMLIFEHRTKKNIPSRGIKYESGQHGQGSARRSEGRT